MTAEELLLNLQDIQPPPEPGWWLLPPVLWGLLLLLILLLPAWTWRSRRNARLRRLQTALAELERIAAQHATDHDDLQLIQSLADWLKRVALEAYPGQGLEPMHGERWLHFLDQSLGDSRFSQGHGAVFGDAVYCRHPQGDSEALLALCRGWLEQVQPRLSQGRARC